MRSLSTRSASSRPAPVSTPEGDRFIGVRVPAIRKFARRYHALPHREVIALLRSGIHEERLLSLVILCDQFERGDGGVRRRIYEAYLDHTGFINNWDLVDASAHKIVGGYLDKRRRRPLDRLAKSSSLWERRIAIIATYFFIKQDVFDDTLRIADLLLEDGEDLIHKAVGWMLREVGKRDRRVEEGFLIGRYRRMPPYHAALCHRALPRTPSPGLPERNRLGPSTNVLRTSVPAADYGDDRVEYLRHDAGLEATQLIG